MRWSSPQRACAMRMTRQSFRCLAIACASSRTMGRFPCPAQLDSSLFLLCVGPLEGVPSSTGERYTSQTSWPKVMNTPRTEEGAPNRFSYRARRPFGDCGVAWWAHLGGIDARQRLDLSDGAAYPRRVPQERAMTERILVNGDKEAHHSSACSFKNRTSSGLVGFTSKRSTATST